MALYSYVKEIKSPKKKAGQYVSYSLLIVGAVLLFWSFYPIISFEIYSRLFIQQSVSTPIPRSQVVTSILKAESVLGTQQVFSSNLKDFVNADLWFPTKPQQHTAPEKVTIEEYSLTIPKLNIVDANVIVGGEDLSQSLIHYLPTTLPGEPGNVAVFGHSTLPQLYSPKNYKSIFTYLPSLEKGDKVQVTVNGFQYEYEIFDMFVVKPDQISVLEQKYDDSYLTLITCVPPGTYWNRLVVRAKITNVPIEQIN